MLGGNHQNTLAQCASQRLIRNGPQSPRPKETNTTKFIISSYITPSKCFAYSPLYMVTPIGRKKWYSPTRFTVLALTWSSNRHWFQTPLIFGVLVTAAQMDTETCFPGVVWWSDFRKFHEVFPGDVLAHFHKKSCRIAEVQYGIINTLDRRVPCCLLNFYRLQSTANIPLVLRPFGQHLLKQPEPT